MIFCETERLNRNTGGMAALYMVIVRMEGWFGVNDGIKTAREGLANLRQRRAPSSRMMRIIW